MHQYLNLLKDIIDNGFDHSDRTTVGRRSVYGRSLRFNLEDGFPLVTTRKIYTNALIREMFWFIKGNTNIKELNDNNVNIWNNWAVDEDSIDKFIEKYIGEDKALTAETKEQLMKNASGQIGPMYGYNWRYVSINDVTDKNNWPVIDFKDIPSDKLSIFKNVYESSKLREKISLEDFAIKMYHLQYDQLNELIVNIKKNPFSSRHIVVAWIPEFIPFESLSPQENVLLGKGALAPCHAFFQCFVTPGKDGNKNKLSLQLNIRSSDVPVGLPYNIAQYALLLSMLAQVLDMTAYELIIITGDTHIYFDQIEKVKEQVLLEPRSLPKLILNPEVKDLFAFTFDDVKIEDYNPLPVIKYNVST